MGSIVIDGNIGSGKSSLMELLYDHMRIPIVTEPVEDWKELLHNFYEDPKRWALSLNLHVLTSFNQNSYKGIQLIERSPMACKYVFAESNYKAGYMSNTDMLIFDKVFDKFRWQPLATIYIKTDPKVCFERMNNRSRDCEKNVSLEYIEDIHNHYEKIMQNIVHLIHGKRLFIVDGNQSKEEIASAVKDILARYIYTK